MTGLRKPAVDDARPSPVTVVIPTIGRLPLLSACLASIAACDPGPAEVLVVDQSEGADAATALKRHPDLPVRVVACRGRGPALGVNVGLREAAHDTVLVTNDDCTVRSDWVRVGHASLARRPGSIVTGRVLAPRRPEAVPSTKDDPRVHDYTGQVVLNALFSANMAVSRSALLSFGGFDERPGLRFASEDNDLCYRWLRAGRTLVYEPEMVIWHHDWRTPAELSRRYVEYAIGDGVLYAKYLLKGDWAILPFTARELWWGLRGTVGGVVRGRPRHLDPRRGILRGLPVGLVLGIRDELAERRRRRGRLTPE